MTIVTKSTGGNPNSGTGSTAVSTPDRASAPSNRTSAAPSRLTALRRVFTAELIKLLSLRSTGYLLLASALSLFLVGGFNAIGIAVQAAQQPGGVDASTLDPTGAATSGVGAALVVVAALGVLAVTGDYATGTIKTTVTAVPRRSHLLLGKTAAIVAVVFPVTLGATLLTFVAAQIALARVNLSISVLAPGVARAILGAALYLTALAVLTAGLGWLIRSTAGALAVWLGLWLVPSLLLLVLPARAAGAVGPYLPGNAGTALAQVTGAGELATWGNFAVFVLYAVLVTAGALAVLVRRDA